MNAEERFWAKVDRRDGGDCWPWLGTTTSTGYGLFGVPREDRTVGAHRYAYELVVGPIPTGLELDHLCRVRNCVNPAHLEPVTHAENLRRGREARGFALAASTDPTGDAS